MVRRWLAVLCMAVAGVGSGHGQERSGSPISLPNGQSGVQYQAAALDYLSVSGGIKPYHFELTEGGSLPPGLELDKNSGVISGAPTEAKLDAFAFSIRVTGAAGAAAAPEMFSVKILPAPLIVTRKALPLRVARNKSVQVKTGNRMDAASIGEPDIRAVVGFHQAGASGASSHQNFFGDFYLDRHLWNPRWRLWGDVRIASTAQQISAPVSQFVAGFATQVGNLRVNQLAQTAEFQTGLERIVKAWDVDWKQSGADGHRVRTFGIVVGGGATGPFNPVDTLQLFYAPTTASSQYSLFKSRYPTAGNYPYVGFVSPDRDRFYRQYQAGIRISTYINSSGGADATNAASRIAAPATYTFTLGQDEAVTGGRFRSVVGRIEVFYPLPITGRTNGLYKFLYLFGTVSLRLTKASNQTPLLLQPAAGVNGYDSGVTIVTAPSNRDNYRIGMGVDFVNLFKTFVACKGAVNVSQCPPSN